MIRRDFGRPLVQSSADSRAGVGQSRLFRALFWPKDAIRTRHHQGDLIAGTHQCFVVGLGSFLGWAAARVSYQKPLLSFELKSWRASAEWGLMVGMHSHWELQPCSFRLGASPQL